MKTPFVLKILAKPLHLMPAKIPEFISAQVLNQVFKTERKAGELDFLESKMLIIEVIDLKLQFKFYLHRQRFAQPSKTRQANIVMSGNSLDFISLIRRQEDPDTLFFQRRLQLSGSTELGLYLKNFLDAFDIESKLPVPLNRFLIRLGIIN